MSLDKNEIFSNPKEFSEQLINKINDMEFRELLINVAPLEALFDKVDYEYMLLEYHAAFNLVRNDTDYRHDIYKRIPKSDLNLTSRSVLYMISKDVKVKRQSEKEINDEVFVTIHTQHSLFHENVIIDKDKVVFSHDDLDEIIDAKFDYEDKLNEEGLSTDDIFTLQFIEDMDSVNDMDYNNIYLINFDDINNPTITLSSYDPDIEPKLNEYWYFK